MIIFAVPRLAQAGEDFPLNVRGPDMARPGDLIVYTIEYQNLTGSLLTDVTLAGHIPERTSFVSASPGCTLYGGIIACHLGGLAEGEGGQVAVTLRVDEDASADALVEFKVMAVNKKPGLEPEFLNHDRGYTRIVIPKLALTKRASTDVVYQGESVTYTYVVANTGNVVLQNVTLVDDHKQPSRVCDPVTELEPGNDFTCTWTTTLDADTTNIGTASGLDPWGDPVTDTASAFVRLAAPDVTLSLNLAASAPRVYAGDTVTYTYVVRNTGSDVAYDVVLRDSLGGKIAGSFDLRGGNSATYVASWMVGEDTTNVARATGQDSLGNSLVATDSVFVDTIQRPDPDGGGILTLTVMPSATSVEAGTVVSYTYVVTNVSQDLVCQVIVYDDQFSYITDFRPVVGGFGILDVPYNFCLEGGESRVAIFPVPLHETTTNTSLASGLDLLMTELLAEATAFVDVSPLGPPGGYFMYLPIVANSGP